MRSMVLLGTAIICLFYIPMFKWFSELIVSTSRVGIILYWIGLTVISILIGVRILGKSLGGETK